MGGATVNPAERNNDVSRLTDLIAQVKTNEPQLGADLEREFKALSGRRAYGLNFERHRPEAVELPQRTPRTGDKVRVLPPRGSTNRGDQRLWRVTKTEQVDEVRVSHVELIGGTEPETQVVAADDLIVVAEFRGLIYPGLVSTGKVERGDEKPFHTVINGENYHILKALTYTHRGKIDAIYIDPPYNTGARDWKYNNNYVQTDDLYRHSKWLAFMERRLLLAKILLNPEDSVLIVTVDEREIHRLGLLIQQIFPEAKTQMVTITVNHRGVARNREFTRVEEYAFFIFFGSAGPALTNDDLLTGDPDDTNGDEAVRWERLIKGSNAARRQDRPNLFYPVHIDPVNKRIVEIGPALSPDAPRDGVKAPDGLVTVWPLARNGTEKRWQLAPETLANLVARGMAKVGSYDRRNDHWSILYLNRGQLERIERGEIAVTGKDANGVLQLERISRPSRAGMTVWNRASHNAGYYGSGILTALIPGRKFPFPKSLYAVEDALRFAVANKPRAIVLDFFAGSGTTAHAVMRLNLKDSGHRQCILVTNNEVSADEQDALRKAGFRPGDHEWEEHGICEYITKPRIEAAITGKTPSGEPVMGDYKFTDEFPISEGFKENAEFFTLTYESPIMIGHNKAFARIAPLLWMRAGSQGRRIDAIPKEGWDVAHTYGILVDLDQTTPFCQAVGKAGSLRVAYIVTDDDRRFQAVTRRLPDSVQPVRLYESYLANFRFANGD